MSTSNISGSKGKHGGARSVLCWEEKLALMDEHVIKEFLSQVNCGCKCNCSDRIRDLGTDSGMKMIQQLRQARLSGIPAHNCNYILKNLPNLDDAANNGRIAVNFYC